METMFDLSKPVDHYLTVDEVNQAIREAGVKAASIEVRALGNDTLMQEAAKLKARVESLKIRRQQLLKEGNLPRPIGSRTIASAHVDPAITRAEREVRHLTARLGDLSEEGKQGRAIDLIIQREAMLRRMYDKHVGSPPKSPEDE